jgi:photosystem II stability/assembly factor-like uncharacterized protein
MKKAFTFIIGLMFCATAFAQVWKPQNLGYGAKVLGMRDLSIVDANTVWVTSYDGFYPFVTNRLEFSRTTNGGTTWQAGVMNFDTAYTTTSIAAVSATEAWTSTYKNTGGGAIFHTTDGGLTWPQSGTGLIFDVNSFPDFIRFKDSLNGVAVGDPNNGYFEIYKTTNRGANWNRIVTSKIPQPLANEYGTPTFAALGNSIWFASDKGRVFYSNDFGSTWAVSTVFTGAKYFGRLAFRDALNGLAIVITNATGAGVVYATSDGGATWTLRANPANLKGGSLSAVPGTNSYISAAQAASPNWGSSISNDDGQTWTQLEAEDNRGTMAFFDKNTGWCGGFSGTGQLGGIFKYSGRTLALTDVEKSFDFMVYPNPVSTVLSVNLKNNHSKSSALFISVTDALGQTIYQEKRDNNAFLTPLDIDFSKYTEGVYLLTIYDGTTSISRNIIKTR